jgi:FkbM family methyltransferase
VGIIGTARKRGRQFNLLRPFLLSGFKAVRWLHHFRKPVVKVVDGIRYELDLNQNIDTSIYFLGAFEPDAVAAMKKFIKPGDVVLDVGANVGCHALLLSKLVGLHDRVIAFGPTDWAFRKPARNKELNLDLCTQNMVLEEVAIADHSRRSQPVQFRSSWRLFGPQTQPAQQVVDILTIDEYVETSAIRKVDFIKVDVDGYEYKVIKGALQTLRVKRPILMVEFGHCTLEGVGDRLEHLVECLFSLVYTIRWDRDLHLFRDRREILETVPTDSTINVICLPEQDIISKLSYQSSFAR